MGAIGGPLSSISLNGRVFSIPEDSSVTQQLKEIENELKKNADGTTRLLRKPQLQMLEGVKVAIDDSQNDLEFLSELNDNGDGGDDGLFNCVAGFPSGAIYAGRCQIIGDIKREADDASAELTLHFSSMKKQ